MSDWYKMNPVDWNDGTDDLTLEQEGAYLRICNAIYITERAVKLNWFVIAGLLRCSDRKAKRLVDELVQAGKLVIENGCISNRRAMDEVSARRGLSVDRASAGKKGGSESAKSRAKALKNNEASQAIASEKTKQNEADKIREERREEESEKSARATLPNGKNIYDLVLAAASSRGQCSESLAMNITPITEFLAQGYDLERDLLPVIREKAKPSVASWKYYITAALGRIADRKAIPPAPKPADVDWPARLKAWRDNETWVGAWGPKPGERNCRVPANLLEHAA